MIVDDLPELNRPQPWMADGLCREYPPEMFFPAGEDSTPRGLARTARRDVEVAAAKAVCQRCAVRVECLTYAIESDEPAGIWGGRTVAERRTLRRHMLNTHQIAT